MTLERRQRAQEVFASAIRRSPETRRAYVDGACEGDAELRREVESLLASFEAVSSGPLESRTIETPPSVMAVLAGKAAAALRAGSRLGSYEILDRLGAGGMGEVYRARDPKLERHVAVKVLSEALSEDPEALDRFEREARAVAALSHPNILSIFDFGKQGETAYAVTELLEGQTLRERLKAGPFGTEELIGLAGQILAGLEAAHSKGIIHRDLKPENLFVTKDGRVKILDFGLAKRGAAVVPGDETTAPTATQHTTPGTVMGTLGYISPEQLLGLPADQRSDLFSLGVILYEMASGGSPFKGKSAVAVADAILHAEPPRLPASAPPRLEALISRLLAKDPAKRPVSAGDVRAEVAALVQAPHRGISRGARIGLVAAAAVAVALGALLWRRSSRERWVHDVATPQIEKLVDARENVKAAALLKEARSIAPLDPALERLWQKATGEISITTDPPGAEVSVRPYGDPSAWQLVGRTPLEKERLPNDIFVFRISKEGYGPLSFLDGPPETMSVKLPTRAEVPGGMTLVPGDDTSLPAPVRSAPIVKIPDFLIDQNEVTNEDYKKFVDAGGYEKPDYWKEPFVKEGHPVAWADAMKEFRDGTGRAGPSTWEAGAFARAKEKHPVAGVSWYEAAAYARFVGKSLPTAYHWSAAAETGLARLILPGSNFRSPGTRPVGDPRGLSGLGTTDMAGNVKEWCSNEEWEGKRFILGGGFGEAEYFFQMADAQSPWDRRANFGFRCVKYLSPPPEAAFAKIDVRFRDYSKEKPAPFDAVRLFKGLYSYDDAPLDARVEERVVRDDWIHERVSFAAAYGGDRVVAHVLLPKNTAPPFQTVVYFPGANGFWDEHLDADGYVDDWHLAFLLKSGRAFVFPVFKSTYERRDGYRPDTYKQATFRDHMLLWSKDLGRTLDYLRTRSDVDGAKLAYFGLSWGASTGPVMLAVNDRFKAAILVAGGFPIRFDPPEATEFNFAPLVTIPVLMIGYRWDDNCPLEASQKPMFRTLGTPLQDKRFVLSDRDHADLSPKELVRECLDWLDKYLGPVGR